MSSLIWLGYFPFWRWTICGMKFVWMSEPREYIVVTVAKPCQRMSGHWIEWAGINWMRSDENWCFN